MAGADVIRRLAAVVAIDVVGYSRLMGADEVGTLGRLKENRAVIDPIIAAHHGRIVGTAGDGLLLEFPSVVDAVNGMIAFQTEMAERNAGKPDAEQMIYRVGINLGDVLVDGDDIFGDGVNVAARLETLAAPGGICLSRAARDQVRDRMDLDLEDLGEIAVKNIARPVRCFAVKLGFNDSPLTPAPTAGAGAPTVAERPPVAVLPFDNLSGDAAQDYFADGMAEDIITALSKTRWFLVIAHNSTAAYRGASPDVRQVAKELDVRYVLKGSVRAAGKRMRIAAQLVDGVTGNHHWADRYDREVEDIFAVQDDITQSVVRAIVPQLHAAEISRIKSAPPESLDAWGCVIRGLWHLGRFTGEDNDRARALLQRAVTLSPDYAKAQSVLAFAEARTVFFGNDMDTAVSTARPIAQTALALDDDDPWSHFAMGYILCFTGAYDEAVAWYRQAIALNENFALAHGNIAAALALNGQADAAIEAVELSLRMSPRDPFNFAYRHFAAIGYLVAERYADGIAVEEQALRERPNFGTALRYLAACHVGLGQMDKGRDAIAEVLRLDPQSSIRRDVFGQVAYARAEDRDRYASLLREAGLPEG